MDSQSPQAGWFACPSCQKPYRFKVELAGRKAQCKGCGCKFMAPSQEGGLATLLELGPAPTAAAVPPPPPRPTAPAKALTPAEESYELNLPGDPGFAAVAPTNQPAVKHTGKCPQCGSKLKAEAILCLNCGYNLAEGKKLQTAVGAAADDQAQGPASAGPKPELLTTQQAFSQAASRVAKSLEDREDEVDGMRSEYVIPLSVLAGGLVLILLNAMLIYDPYILIDRMNKLAAASAAVGFATGPSAPAPIVLRLVQLARMGATVLLQIPFLFVGLFAVARLFGTSFGYIVPAMVKILACAVAVSAIDYTVYFLLDRVTDGFAFIGSMFSSAVSFGTFWALTSWLFDLEIMEMFVLYILTAMLPIYAGAMIFALLYTTFG